MFLWHIQVSRNIVMEAHLIRTAHFIGITCTAFQHHEVSQGLSEPAQEQQLHFRCSTGSHNISLNNFPLKVKRHYLHYVPFHMYLILIIIKIFISRILLHWPLWLSQQLSFLLMSLMTVSYKLQLSEVAGFSLYLETWAEREHILANLVSTLLLSMLVWVRMKLFFFSLSH